MNKNNNFHIFFLKIMVYLYHHHLVVLHLNKRIIFINKTSYILAQLF